MPAKKDVTKTDAGKNDASQEMMPTRKDACLLKIKLAKKDARIKVSLLKDSCWPKRMLGKKDAG